MTIYEGNMDKPVSAQTKRKRKIKAGLIIGSVLIIGTLSVTGINKLIKPVFSTNQIKIGTVSRGNVYESIVASGVIETENENIILSPASSKLIKIVNGAGTQVQKGDTLLVLDAQILQENLDKLQNQLKLKKNSFWQFELNTKKLKLNLVHSLEVKKLRITELETQLFEEEQLFKVGGTSEERIRKTKQEISLARKELVLVQKENAIELEKLDASKQALDVEIAMSEQALNKARNTVLQASVLAPITGIVVEIKGREGEMVSANQPLARISDLETFKLNGTISDSFADKVNSGGKVLAINNDTRLEGVIGNIRPIVDNGQIKFDVYLKQNNHPDLRPNQKMEVRVIVSEQENTLRLPDGPFFDGSKELEVFIVNGNSAIRKKVKPGLSNFDFVEFTEGLIEGDEVIISDVSKYIHLEEVEIKE